MMQFPRALFCQMAKKYISHAMLHRKGKGTAQEQGPSPRPRGMSLAGVLESTRPEYRAPRSAHAGIREPLAHVEETTILEWDEDEIQDTCVPVPAPPLLADQVGTFSLGPETASDPRG